jgi:hypothetical protein
MPPWSTLVTRLTASRAAGWVTAGATAALLLVATLVYVLAPAGAGSIDEALPGGATVLARASVGDTEVFVLGRGDRMQLAVAYEDIKGWRVTATSPVPRSEAVVWAALSRRDANVSAVYGRLDGAPPTVTWEDGQTTAGTPSGTVWLTVRTGHHDCGTVSPVGPGGTTFDC